MCEFVKESKTKLTYSEKRVADPQIGQVLNASSMNMFTTSLQEHHIQQA